MAELGQGFSRLIRDARKSSRLQRMGLVDRHDNVTWKGP